MNAPEPRSYEFAGFRLDATARQLCRRDGAPVALTPRVFDTLLYLVQHPGSLLGKDELLAAIWPGRVVEENNLTQSISTLRKVLGADADGQRYIVTEPGRGYRFVADVKIHDEAVVPEAAAEPASSDAPVPAPPTPPGAGARRALSARAFVLTGLALLALIVAGALIARKPAPAAATAATTTIAVLPFKPVVASARDEVLELGMADTLIAKLSSSRRLTVRSLSSVRRFDGLGQDPLAAGRELGVGSVLEGHVQRRADHLHVTARLLSVSSGSAMQEIERLAGQLPEGYSIAWTGQSLQEQQAEDRRRQDGDDLPTRQSHHGERRFLPDRLGGGLQNQFLESLAGATSPLERTSVIIARTTLTVTPWAISTPTSLSSTRTILPIMPFDNTTVSLRLMAARVAMCSLARFCCGRISMK